MICTLIKLNFKINEQLVKFIKNLKYLKISEAPRLIWLDARLNLNFFKF